MLPYEMVLACQLHVALHRSNHSKGMAEGMSYPEKIKQDLKKFAEDIEAGKFCDNPKSLRLFKILCQLNSTDPAVRILIFRQPFSNSVVMH